MPTVEVSFTALPAHVRTARLVALAVARRAGVTDDLLDEIRLAVGEASIELLTSAWVTSRRLQRAGFEFGSATLPEALAAELASR